MTRLKIYVERQAVEQSSSVENCQTLAPKPRRDENVQIVRPKLANSFKTKQNAEGDSLAAVWQRAVSAISRKPLPDW
jgi:hypothetical protein